MASQIAPVAPVLSLKVDLDIHTYSYVAKTALVSFMTRLASVIWEVAFVIQGNAADELPEQVWA